MSLIGGHFYCNANIFKNVSLLLKTYSEELTPYETERASSLNGRSWRESGCVHPHPQTLRRVGLAQPPGAPPASCPSCWTAPQSWLPAFPLTLQVPRSEVPVVRPRDARPPQWEHSFSYMRFLSKRPADIPGRQGRVPDSRSHRVSLRIYTCVNIFFSREGRIMKTLKEFMELKQTCILFGAKYCILGIDQRYFSKA